MREKEERLETGAAARYVGVSENTIRSWERAGRLAAERTVGGRRLFTRRELERVRQEREAK